MDKNILLKIEYDGSCFSGWQKQPKKRTVQGEVENALQILLNRPVSLNGTGRTDAGVHALGQCASFSADIKKMPVKNMSRALTDILSENRQKSGAIRIISAEEVPEDFHARFSAVGKTYVYRIFNAPCMPVFLRNYRYNVKKALNFDEMRKASEYIKGTHDFKSFEAAGGTPRANTVRDIYSINIAAEAITAAPAGNPTDNAENSAYNVSISVTGSGFLYNMVRIIAGTLVDTGLGKISADSIPDILISRDRSRAGHTAPPQGLFLREVFFSKDELNRRISDESYNR